MRVNQNEYNKIMLCAYINILQEISLFFTGRKNKSKINTQMIKRKINRVEEGEWERAWKEG